MYEIKLVTTRKPFTSSLNYDILFLFTSFSIHDGWMAVHCICIV